jgi:ubiquinone/menaquinone biosynthesis C-methylase UbiE
MTSSTSAGRATLDSVRNFWENHVNNEYYTAKKRGSPAYFGEIERRRYRSHYHLRRLFAQLQGSSGRLLEIGCGIGVDSIQLSRCGFHVTGLDLTDSAIEVARQFADTRGVEVDFDVGNGEQLEFDDETFDAVYSFGVLHHTPAIESAVAEVRRVLKPGGTAYVMLYHRSSFVNLVHRLLRLPYESPRHLKDHCPVVYTFTKKTAAQLFEAFSDVEIHADYPFTYGFRYLTFWVPDLVQRVLGRWVGWHLMIRAVR